MVRSCASCRAYTVDDAVIGDGDFAYCSGAEWPGMIALFRPSMPMLIAPLRLTLAL